MERALNDIEYCILCAVIDRPRHGYAIQKWIKANTKLQISHATLYTTIKRLSKFLLEETISPHQDELEDSRRIYYQITDKGSEKVEEKSAWYLRMSKLSQNHKD